MCTVTIVPHAHGVRLLCNRDERRTRAAASPPQVHDLGGRQAVFPVDPEGGGTWGGANEAGVAAALLNVQRAPDAAQLAATRSRGLIVRELLAYPTVESATGAVLNLDPCGFEPFRLVIVQGRRLSIVSSDGHSTRHRRRTLTRPALFTSSSLGDALVGPSRRRLFARMVVHGPAGWLNGQAEFHDHQWPRRPGISVRMERADALTVSRMTVDITAAGVQVAYEAPVSGAGANAHASCCCLP